MLVEGGTVCSREPRHGFGITINEMELEREGEGRKDWIGGWIVR